MYSSCYFDNNFKKMKKKNSDLQINYENHCLLKSQMTASPIQNRGKVCNFAFLTSSEGKFYEFFVTFALVIHPLTVENRPCALIWACALNRKNTVC